MFGIELKSLSMRINQSLEMNCYGKNFQDTYMQLLVKNLKITRNVLNFMIFPYVLCLSDYHPLRVMEEQPQPGGEGRQPFGPLGGLPGDYNRSTKSQPATGPTRGKKGNWLFVEGENTLKYCKMMT